MLYRLAADLTLLIHFLFVIFVVFGGLLCLSSWRWIWIHLPAIFWGVWIEWSGKVCPLTPLENHFRELAGQQGYNGGFIEHYLIPVLYPSNLTQFLQWSLGILVIIVNIIVYATIIRHLKVKHRHN